MDGQGRGLGRVSGIGWPFGAVSSEGAEAGGVFSFRRDPHDMAAAFALAVIVDEQASLRGEPGYRRDRSQTGEAAPRKFTRRIVALGRHRLADIVIVPARSAVSPHGFGAGVVIGAGNDIAAGRAVKRIARPIGLEGDLAR